MNTQTNAPSDEALLRANLLGFATQVKAAHLVQGKEIADSAVVAMHKSASERQAATMTKLAKIREIILQHVRPAAPAAA